MLSVAFAEYFGGIIATFAAVPTDSEGAIPKLLCLNIYGNYFNQIFWITKNQKIYSELKERELPVLHLYSLKGFIAILRSNFLITSHFINDVSFFFIFQEDLIKFKPGMKHQ